MTRATSVMIQLMESIMTITPTTVTAEVMAWVMP